MRKKLLISILFIALLASCASTSIEETEPEQDNSSIIIELSENPSTGYSWIWGQMGTGHIELLDETFIPGEEIGTPGTHVYTFIGTVPGHVTLTFSSRQLWAGGAIGESEAFSVTVYDDMTISYL